MPKSCVAYNCTNRFVQGSGVSFHKFPFSDENSLRFWIRSLRRENFTPTNHSFLCSVHFSPDCFYENHIERRLLRDDAIPTLFDFPEHLKKVPEGELLVSHHPGEWPAYITDNIRQVLVQRGPVQVSNVKFPVKWDLK